MEHSNAKVAIVIPYYEGEDCIQECLSSISASNYAVSEIYISDNSPTRFQTPTSFTLPLAILTLPIGIGFGRACNVGIHQALNDGYDFTIILNQDAILSRDGIGYLLDAMQDTPNLAAVAPLSYDPSLLKITDRTWQKYVLPIENLAQDLKTGDLKTWYAVDYTQINGACVCFRNALISKFSLFDPVFHLYGEDTELFQRLLYQHHYLLGVVPKAKIGHRHSNFTAQDKRADRIAAYVRNGMLVCWLKDPRRSVINALFKALIVAGHTQWQTLTAGEFHRLPLFWRKDLQLLLQIPEIIRRRNPTYLAKVVQRQLTKDYTKPLN